MKTKSAVLILISGVLLLMFSSHNSLAQNKDWIVPAKFVKLENPTNPNSEDMAIGKSLYAKHCRSCHGKTGRGDGPKAAEVKGDLGDFASEGFQAQTDGELFYKSYEGRDDMPNYRKKIPNEEDMWLIVHFMRTMGPEPDK
jgi:mono/diheme cytochrome c family protein